MYYYENTDAVKEWNSTHCMREMYYEVIVQSPDRLAMEIEMGTHFYFLRGYYGINLNITEKKSWQLEY